MRAKITAQLLKKLKATGKGYDVNDTELPGFGVRVSPEGVATSYSVRYRTASGRRQRLKIGSTKILTPRQARDLAQEALADATKGDDPQNIRKSLRGINTLGGFIEDEYAPQELASHKSGEMTHRRIWTCFRDFYNRPLVDRKWHADILAWRAKRLEEGRAQTTVNRDVASLRAVFSHAVRTGALPENPLRQLRQFKTDSQVNIRYLSEDEEQRLLTALDEREERLRSGRFGDELNADRRETPFADYLKPMVLISINTGLRRGELFGIEWRDVDLERANLTLRGEITKNRKTRHMPLNSIANAVLRDWKTQTTGEGLVFVSPTTGERFRNVDVMWRNILKEADIKDFRWHDQRHHFASRLLMACVDLNTVRDLLGHRDIAMTLRYAHLAPEHKAAAVERLVSENG